MRKYIVYTIELADGSLYVGQTGKSREQRIEDYRTGHRVSRLAKKVGVVLESFRVVETCDTWEESIGLERQVYDKLKASIAKVCGGH